MLTWLFGIAFSLSFYFVSTESSISLQILPLTIGATLALLVGLKNIRENENATLQIAALATFVLCIILFWSQQDEIYTMFTVIFGIICLLFIITNARLLFIAPPRWLAVSNSISILCSAITYILIYADIKKHVENFSMLIPLTILIFIEVYIIVKIQSMETLQDTKKTQLTQQRVSYLLVMLIVYISSVLYIAEAITLTVNMSICVSLYTIGFLLQSSQELKNICQTSGARAVADYKIVSEA